MQVTQNQILNYQYIYHMMCSHHTWAHMKTICTHKWTHTQKAKAKFLAAVRQSHPPSEALGWLRTTTQALKASAGKLTWGRASTLQVGLYHVPGWWCVHLKSHWDHTHYRDMDSSLTFAFPQLFPCTHWCYSWVVLFPWARNFTHIAPVYPTVWVGTWC